MYPKHRILTTLKVVLFKEDLLMCRTMRAQRKNLGTDIRTDGQEQQIMPNTSKNSGSLKRLFSCSVVMVVTFLLIH